MNIAKIGLNLAGLGLPCVLAGCATQPTMAELEQEVAKTGDWSRFESPGGPRQGAGGRGHAGLPGKSHEVIRYRRATHDVYLCVASRR